MVNRKLVFIYVSISILLFSCGCDSSDDEAKIFLVKHEDKMKVIVDYCKDKNYYSREEYDNKFDSLLNDIDVRSCYTENGIVFIDLYRFIVTGYGIAYSERADQFIPQDFHKCPMQKWFNIRGNWYYFEYAD